MPLNSTSTGTVREQVILSSLGFEGCGRLTMCHLLVACTLVENKACNIEVQLYSNALGGFALKSTSSFQEVPSNSTMYTLSITLDMEFTTGDVVGFGFSNNPSIHRFDIHIASAPNHTYLQWMTSGTTLSVQNATTVNGTLPILSVEGMLS